MRNCNLRQYFPEIYRNCYDFETFHNECEDGLRSCALLAKAAEDRLSAHLQQITRFHLSMLLTNQIIAFHSTKEVLLAKAAEGRLSAHLQQLMCSIYLYQTENWRFPNVSYWKMCVHESLSSLKMMTYFLFLLTSNDDSKDNMNRYIPYDNKTRKTLKRNFVASKTIN